MPITPRPRNRPSDEDYKRAIEHCDKVLTIYQGLAYKIPLAYFTFAMAALYALLSEAPDGVSGSWRILALVWVGALNVVLTRWQYLLLLSSERHRVWRDRYVRRLSGRAMLRGTSRKSLWGSMWVPVLALPFLASFALTAGVCGAFSPHPQDSCGLVPAPAATPTSEQ